MNVAGSNPVSRSRQSGVSCLGSGKRGISVLYHLLKLPRRPQSDQVTGFYFATGNKKWQKCSSVLRLEFKLCPGVPSRGVVVGWRRTQVVRERSAKPLCGGSNPSGASGSSQNSKVKSKNGSIARVRFFNF